MKYRAIPVSRVRVPEVRVTAQYDEEKLQLLKDTLKAMGQRVPIVVVQVGEDYELVDGLHRLQEAQAQGLTLIEAVISQGEAKDVLLQNLVLNQVRGKVRATDLVKVIGELTSKHGMDSEAIKDATGFSRDYIEKLWKVAEAAPEVVQALDEGLIGVGQAYEVSRLPRHIQQAEMIATFPVGRWTVKETKAFVEQVLAQMREPRPEGAPAAPQAPPRYVCSTCEREMEQRFLNMVQLCPDCMKAAWSSGQELKARVPSPLPAGPGTPSP